MHISWGGLGSVFVVSLAVAVVVVVLFSLGIVAVGKRTAAFERHTWSLGPTVTAALCFAACVVLVLYGLYLIIAG
ncbi:hypothetical protein [Saccharopolyspora hattusasensis]|uniref:hypothetical protein n=1 Tax=Saccharopolyspora hattusasensis TaxID=1128679 RepID=UPI003D979D9B